MSFDEPSLQLLLEESQDVHSDAMRTTRGALHELVDTAHDSPRSTPAPESGRHVDDVRRAFLHQGLLAGGALATVGFGAALLRLFESAAFADTTTDVQIVQTAASLENLAVATYSAALTLPFIGGAQAIPVVKAFAQTTRSQHADHAQAFNAAAKQLGGKEQTAPDPVLLQLVNNAKPTLTGPGPVLDLAIELELTATQDYVAGVAALGDGNAKRTMASIMGVESQHAAVLMAVKALVTAGHPELVTLPPAAADLPEAAGSVGFPDPFIKTEKARPNDEGAVK